MRDEKRRMYLVKDEARLIQSIERPCASSTCKYTVTVRFCRERERREVMG